MKPFLHRVEDGPQDRQTLHEAAVAFAVKEFDRSGEVPCVWLLAAPDSTAWIKTPWESELEKMFTVEMLRHAIKERDCHAYAFITEAWLASEMVRRGETFDIDKVVPPSERPDREEVVLIMSFERDGPHQVTRFTIDPETRALKPREDDTAPTLTAGRMWNLFEEARQ